MTLRRTMGLLILALAAFGAVASAQRHEDEDQGLVISIAKVSAKQTDRVFRVELRNAGATDLMLNLGILLGNGKQYPMAVHLLVTNEAGRTYEMNAEGPAIIGGTITPLLVPLSREASYSVAIDLDRCGSSRDKLWAVKQGDTFRLPLPAGRYQVRAAYANSEAQQGVSLAHGQMLAYAHMQLWTGHVVSEPVTMVVPRK